MRTQYLTSQESVIQLGIDEYQRVANMSASAEYESVKEAADRVGVSESWVRNAIRTGALEGQLLRLGGRVLLVHGWERAVASDPA